MLSTTTTTRPKSQLRYSKKTFERAIERRDRHTVRAVGEGLHALGGIPLMTEKLWDVADDYHRIINWVSTMWEGIGGQWYR